MKGIVFNLLEHCVTREYDAETWDELLEAAGVGGAYTSLGTYADQELTALVEAASNRLEILPKDVLRWFGRSAMGPLSKRYSEMLDSHQSSISFLLTLNDVIHPEVRKQYPEAEVPVFDMDTPREGIITMRYTSPRKMCAYAEGLLEGVAIYFNERVTVEQQTCMHRGDAACLFVCAFTEVRHDE